jgi:shikimate 5-dehydrogenase
MLLMQGVAAFERWYPDVSPPVEIMRAALRDALR